MPIVIETEEELAELLRKAEHDHASAPLDAQELVPWPEWYAEYIFDEYGD